MQLILTLPLGSISTFSFSCISIPSFLFYHPLIKFILLQWFTHLLSLLLISQWLQLAFALLNATQICYLNPKLQICVSTHNPGISTRISSKHFTLNSQPLLMYFSITCSSLHFGALLVLLHIAIVHLLSLLYSIPLYEHTSIYLSIYFEMNIWVLGGVLFVVMSMCTHARRVSLGYETKNEIEKLQSTHKPNFSQQYQTVFKMIASVYIHRPQYVKVLVAPYSYSHVILSD